MMKAVAGAWKIGRTSVRRILAKGPVAEMAKPKDPIREERIDNEAIVDAYGPEEQALGWYYYLQDKIRFSFQARCTVTKTVSPLLKGELSKSRAWLQKMLLRRHARADPLARPEHGGSLVSTATYQGEQSD
jgi:hypothetical protein